MKRELFELQGTVEEVVFHNDETGFTVFDLVTESEYITIVGTFSDLAPGEELSLKGSWNTHPTFGRQFRAEWYERKMPSTAAELYKYLASGAVNGIRAKTAQKIIERFGEDSFDVLENYPEKLTQIKGISPQKAEKISKSFKEQFAVRQIMISLERFGLTPLECLQVYKAFGADAYENIRSNPYMLCEDPIDMSFERAELIADDLPEKPDIILRQSAGIIYILKHNLNNGHTCLPRRKIILPATQLLDSSCDDIEAVVDNLIKNKRLISANIYNEEFLFLPESYYAENGAAQKVEIVLNFPPAGVPTLLKDIERVEQRENIIYDDTQKSAIFQAVEKGLLILTGGPGTGKTTTLNAIIKMFETQGLKVVLTAPTGRAAKRMSEVSGKDATTIHRLLIVDWDKYGKPYFVHNMTNPIDADVLIVDELSMVDISLFYSLIKALPLGCRLIMVGDSEQLPAVGAGAVLHDLIGSGRLPVVELKKVFRQALKSKIVTNAHDIVNGRLPDLTCKDNDFFFMKRNSNQSVVKTVVDLCSSRLPKAYGYSPLTDIQVLCPSRKGDCGSVSLNKALQAAINPPSPKKAEIAFNGKIFRVGDKVMQTKNNYQLLWKKDGEEGSGIFNGDIGIITSVDDLDSTVTIEFDDERVAVYPFSNLIEVEHAYAITVHKSQGNEFDAVIMPVFSVPSKLCYRNLLYTAVTRAKKMMILVGDEEIVRLMTENNSKTKRYSALKEFLCSENSSYDEQEENI